MVHKTWKRSLHAALVLTILISMVITMTASASYIYPKPPWWNSSTCDDSYYYSHTDPQVHSTLITTWNGIDVCGPLPVDGGESIIHQFTTGGSSELEWECAELVKRYLYLSMNTISLGNAHGYQVVQRYAEYYPDSFIAIPNGGTEGLIPKAGDIISYGDNNPYNHTAIVTGVTWVDEINGDATLDILEQNGVADGTTTQNIVDWIIRGGPDSPNDYSSIVVTGWLTPRWTVENVTGTGTLKALSATSDADVWAVGGTVAYHYTGSWSGDTYTGSTLLNGVTAISSSNVVAVGYASSLAKAIKYNGTSWSDLAVQTSGTSSFLNGVDYDGTGNTWAVGYALNGGEYRPLIEVSSGGNFTKVEDPYPSHAGSTDVRLTSISMLSSDYGWAVGYYTDGSSHRHPVSLFYDGSEWGNYDGTDDYEDVPEIGGMVNTILYGVTVAGIDDVWAVGQYTDPSVAKDRPFAAHWDGSDWTIDASISPIADSYSSFAGIYATNSSEIYAVGSTGSIGISKARPLIYRYDGTEWLQVFLNPVNFSSSYSRFTAITLIDGIAFATGVEGSNGHLIQRSPIR